MTRLSNTVNDGNTWNPNMNFFAKRTSNWGHKRELDLPLLKYTFRWWILITIGNFFNWVLLDSTYRYLKYMCFKYYYAASSIICIIFSIFFNLLRQHESNLPIVFTFLFIEISIHFFQKHHSVTPRNRICKYIHSIISTLQSIMELLINT